MRPTSPTFHNNFEPQRLARPHSWCAIVRIHVNPNHRFPGLCFSHHTKSFQCSAHLSNFISPTGSHPFQLIQTTGLIYWLFLLVTLPLPEPWHEEPWVWRAPEEVGKGHLGVMQSLTRARVWQRQERQEGIVGRQTKWGSQQLCQQSGAEGDGAWGRWSPGKQAGLPIEPPSLDSRCACSQASSSGKYS